jgi:hypothetical protein
MNDVNNFEVKVLGTNPQHFSDYDDVSKVKSNRKLSNIQSINQTVNPAV